jgi:hypothetical protein
VKQESSLHELLVWGSSCCSRVLVLTVSFIMYTLRYCAAATLNQRLYVVGGLDEVRTRLALVEAYDPREGRWTSLAPLSAARSSCGLAALTIGSHGRIYAGKHQKETQVKAGPGMRTACEGEVCCWLSTHMRGWIARISLHVLLLCPLLRSGWECSWRLACTRKCGGERLLVHLVMDLRRSSQHHAVVSYHEHLPAW